MMATRLRRQRPAACSSASSQEATGPGSSSLRRRLAAPRRSSQSSGVVLRPARQRRTLCGASWRCCQLPRPRARAGSRLRSSRRAPGMRRPRSGGGAPRRSRARGSAASAWTVASLTRCCPAATFALAWTAPRTLRPALNRALSAAVRSRGPCRSSCEAAAGSGETPVALDGQAPAAPTRRTSDASCSWRLCNDALRLDAGPLGLALKSMPAVGCSAAAANLGLPPCFHV
mmetsp:Transcript_68808/g.190496  ORF Transcript_68808/g.190496 Transcript_68808/m.190496 type:complete len:230 (+) Transcript_68808:1421-2110(+)